MPPVQVPQVQGQWRQVQVQGRQVQVERRWPGLRPQQQPQREGAQLQTNRLGRRLPPQGRRTALQLRHPGEAASAASAYCMPPP